MKTSLILALPVLAAAALTSGCISYSRTSQPSAVVVTETTRPGMSTVVTTLPSGYQTRTYRGRSYYYANDTVYQANPKGGYVTVPRPW